MYIYITVHLLADFTFQLASLAEAKQTKWKALLLHGLIYFAAFGIVNLTFLDLNVSFPAFIMIVGSHLLIDWGRNYLEKKLKNKSLLFGTFILDQTLHLIIIVYAT